MSIKIDEIPEKLDEAVKDTTSFFKSFLSAYDLPKSSITRAMNEMAENGIRRCSIKQKILYLECKNTDDIERDYLNFLEERKAKERFVFVTDFKRILAKDMLSSKGLDIPFSELSDNYEFFLPWCGREIVEQEVENPADVKAASEMGHLFEIIHEHNKDNTELTERSQNIFLTRLLFCCFADDTGIFKSNQFRDSLRLNTAEDGSDTKDYLNGLFVILNTKPSERANVHPKYKDFPYVNGGLFREQTPIPNFDKVARRKLLECTAVDWSGINPDIFGSMFQTVINPEQRRNLGQHYTSVTNIMKVLKPLFLDSLNDRLNEILEEKKESTRNAMLHNFINRLGKIVVFDPACGSGNFLIVAYKELCHLQMKAIEARTDGVLPMLTINLSNFYGIEIDDFPCEVARLALWLVQHQINQECSVIFNRCNPTLPLTESGVIVCGNSLSLDWKSVCPLNDDNGNGREIYLCGNPPYLGGSLLSEAQKIERDTLTNGIKNNGFFDYITCWFVKAAGYMENRPKVRTAFVTTNSVCQGMQVTLWPYIFSKGIEISFCYESFKWRNNAKDVAGVTVTVIGMASSSLRGSKYIYKDGERRKVSNISPYLIEGNDKIVTNAEKSICEFAPSMEYGTKFCDDGNLILSLAEKEELCKQEPSVEKYLHKLIGSDEFINGKERWCIWIKDNQLKEAESIPEVKQRIENIRIFRLKSLKKSTKENANIPWKPTEIRFKDDVSAIIVPRVSSEKRKYMPVGYLPANTVISDSAFAIYGAPLWLFSIIVSNMHMCWMKTVAGRLKTDFRYSCKLVYNTFPFPHLTDNQKKQLEDSAMRIIEAREAHYDMTMAQLYNEDTMPEDLKCAHESNDLIVDRLFKRNGFTSDEERLAELFRLYEINTHNRGGLL